jgi:hypothetical protein
VAAPGSSRPCERSASPPERARPGPLRTSGPPSASSRSIERSRSTPPRSPWSAISAASTPSTSPPPSCSPRDPHLRDLGTVASTPPQAPKGCPNAGEPRLIAHEGHRFARGGGAVRALLLSRGNRRVEFAPRSPTRHSWCGRDLPTEDLEPRETRRAYVIKLDKRRARHPRACDRDDWGNGVCRGH